MSLKILWHSAPAYYPTGYGVQTRNFAKRIAMMGHEIVIASTTASPGMLWEGLMHIPGGNENYGADGLLEWPKRIPIDLVVTLFDIWMFPEDIGARIKTVGPDWAPISPIDHNPIPPDVEKRLRHASYPIAMCPYAMREMQRVGLNPHYIPHGVDTKVYRPSSRNKKTFDADGKFLVGIVASNIEKLDRKGFRPAFEAFGRFHEKHPDSVLYAHCLPTQIAGGLDLVGMSKLCNFELYVPDMWHYMAVVPEEKMAELYSTFDVLLMTTRGEGFCVPLIESQSCGTPVIVTDFTAPSDLVGAGWKIPIAGKRWTPTNSWWAEPDVDATVEALEEAYEMYKSHRLRSQMKEKAREFAKDFDFDVVTEKYLMPFLEDVEHGKKSNAGSGQETDQHLSERGIHNREQRETKDKRSKRRRKKR